MAWISPAFRWLRGQPIVACIFTEIADPGGLPVLDRYRLDTLDPSPV